MAEQNQEITYLPYGLDEISQLDLMTSLANGVPSYLESKRWAKKDKYRLAWLNAYQDIINHGLTGASNSSGVWAINHGGDAIDLNTKSNIEKEMYLDAAWYIQQQMSLMTPRSKLEEEKKEEKKLDKFDFIKGFNELLLRNRFGGNPNLFKDPDEGWNSLDPRGENGLRGTEGRRKEMISQLRSYLDGLEGKEFDFEGTPFTDINDAKTKILTAINALEQTPNDITDDIPALNALGLQHKAYFSNGGNEATTHINEATGNPYTYNEWNEYQQLLTKAKIQADAKASELRKQAAYNNTLFFNRVTSPKMLGWNPTALKEKYKDSNSLLTTLQGYALKDIRTLTPDELSEIHGAYRYLANQPIDNKLLNQIRQSSSGLYRNAAPNRFRKINGIDNLIWDSVAGQLIQINTRQQLLALLNQPLDLFANIQTKEDIQNTPISKEGWTSADTADVVSMIGDLVSLGGFWANVGGTATSLTSDLYADIARGKDLGSILKGVGVNLGWGLAGMLPGAKSTKLVARTARLIPKAIMTVLSAGIILDPEILKSAMKFTTVDGLKTVSSKDLENLKYLFHAVTGGTNIARSHVRAKNYREQLNKLKVQTKEGTKNLSNKDIKEINKAGRKGGQKAAEELFEKKTGQKAAEGLFKFSENGKSRFNPARYSSTLSKMFGNDLLLKGELTTDLRAMSQILLKDRELPWYNWNKGYATFELTPFRSNPPIKLELSKQRINTLLKVLELKILNHDLKLLENKSNPRELLFDKATINRYKEHLKGNFSNKKIQEGTLKIGDKDMNITSTTNLKNGKVTYDIHFGNKHFYNLTLDKAKLKIFDLVKENRKLVDKTNGTISKKSTKEIGKILLDLKRKGWLKKGGTINPSLDTIIEDFIKNNNI